MEDDVILIPGDTTVVVSEIVQTIVVSAPDSLVVVEPSPDLILVNNPSILILESDGGSGPAGPPGPSAPENLFIQDAPPTPPGYNYVWAQTFPNHDLSFWVEDGH